MQNILYLCFITMNTTCNCNAQLLYRLQKFHVICVLSILKIYIPNSLVCIALCQALFTFSMFCMRTRVYVCVYVYICLLIMHGNFFSAEKLLLRHAKPKYSSLFLLNFRGTKDIFYLLLSVFQFIETVFFSLYA